MKIDNKRISKKFSKTKPLLSLSKNESLSSAAKPFDYPAKKLGHRMPMFGIGMPFQMFPPQQLAMMNMLQLQN